MSHSVESIDKLVADVGGIFDHPAFLPLKLRDAAFGLVRVSDGDVLWVNDSAAAFWGTRDLRRLGQNFAAPAGPGLGLESLVRGTTVWASPRLGRLRLAHGFRLRNHVVLFRTGTDADGAVLLGFALPETAADEDHAEMRGDGGGRVRVVEREDAPALPRRPHARTSPRSKVTTRAKPAIQNPMDSASRGVARSPFCGIDSKRPSMAPDLYGCSGARMRTIGRRRSTRRRLRGWALRCRSTARTSRR